MKMVIRIIVYISLFPLILLAETINLTGKIVDQIGNPIPLAEISLDSLKYHTLSDSSGFFQIKTIATPVVNNLMGELHENINIRDGIIDFAAGNSEISNIEVFNLAGRLLDKREIRRSSNKCTYFNLRNSINTSQISIVRITTKEKTIIFKVINYKDNFISTKVLTKKVNGSNTGASNRSIRQVNYMQDTLKVFAEGYKSISVPIDAFTAFYRITLESSSKNEWLNIQVNKIYSTHNSSIILDSALYVSNQIIWNSYGGYKKELMADTAKYTELESYRVNTQRLIEISLDSNNLIVTNWLPRNMYPITIIGTYKGENFTLYEIDTLPGLKQMKLKLPWKNGYKFFTNRITKNTITIPSDSVFISCDYVPENELQAEIKNHPINWDIQFGDRIMNGNADVCRDANVVWRPNRPQFVRYLWTFIINASQTVAEKTFYEFWMKTPFYDLKNIISDEYKLTLAEYETYPEDEKNHYNLTYLDSGYYYNKDHRHVVYEKYFNKKFDFGNTGGGGLGGGSTVGLNHTKIFEYAWTYGQQALDAYENNEWYLPEDDNSATSTPFNIFGHEGGHALGFSHKSNYCVRERYSHIAVGTIVYTGLLVGNKLWITPETMIGRDESWEAPYDKKSAPESRSRPRCGDAFEWGGVYGRHDIQMPQKGTPEWDLYIEAHLKGEGLAYLAELAISPGVYYDWWTE